MRDEPKGYSPQLADQSGNARYLRRANRHRFFGWWIAVLAVIALCGEVASADDNGASESRREIAKQLRQFIDQQVGGIDKLKVPATDVDIPLPRQQSTL